MLFVSIRYPMRITYTYIRIYIYMYTYAYIDICMYIYILLFIVDLNSLSSGRPGQAKAFYIFPDMRSRRHGVWSLTVHRSYHRESSKDLGSESYYVHPHSCSATLKDEETCQDPFAPLFGRLCTASLCRRLPRC